tara:strand:+ start:257 stop:460 length:204 start_codon:yes stop_codon:yes gene_type:complete
MNNPNSPQDKIKYFHKNISKILFSQENSAISFLNEIDDISKLNQYTKAWPTDIKALLVDRYLFDKKK